ncbi:MAG TPA: PIG-L family deacetylase [Methylomirabilota bacterium]|nr:PIG-L family deacetylase [Methylomirabilota bacterium]
MSDAVSRIWTTAFQVAGSLRRQSARPWEPSGGKRVLVVAPHPDDEVLGCGGTILRHRRDGDRVAVVCVTDGRGRPGAQPDPEAYARRRRDEMERAAGVLGVEGLDWLGLPEWRWEPGDLTSRLGGVLAHRAPDLLYLPSRVDYHPEHRKTAHGMALVLGPPVQGPLVRVYQVQVPLTSVLVNRVVDTSAVAPDLARALDAYATQRETAGSCVRLSRYAAAFHHVDVAAEEFWELSAASYHETHRDPPQRWSTTTYRGLRRGALTDPAAYVVGRRRRRVLAAEAGRLGA